MSQKRVVEAEITERQKELQALEVLINSQRKREGLPPEPGSPLANISVNGDGEKQRRVRGTLKAAKEAALLFGVPFTRSDLFSKIEELNPGLAGKIKPEAQRGTMRTLAKDRLIEPTDEERNGEALYQNLGKK